MHIVLGEPTMRHRVRGRMINIYGMNVLSFFLPIGNNNNTAWSKTFGEPVDQLLWVVDVMQRVDDDDKVELEEFLSGNGGSAFGFSQIALDSIYLSLWQFLLASRLVEFFNHAGGLVDADAFGEIRGEELCIG